MTAHHGTLLCPKIPTSARGVSGQTIHSHANPRKQLQKTTSTMMHPNLGPHKHVSSVTSQSFGMDTPSLSLSDYHGGKGYLYDLLYPISFRWHEPVFWGKGINSCIPIQLRPNHDSWGNNSEALNFDTGNNLPCLQPYPSQTRPRFEGRWYSWVNQLALRS